MPEKLWKKVHNIVQEAMNKTIPKKKKSKKAKWLSEEALQIAKKQKGKDYRSLQENWRYQENILPKDGQNKGQKW